MWIRIEGQCPLSTEKKFFIAFLLQLPFTPSKHPITVLGIVQFIPCKRRKNSPSPLPFNNAISCNSPSPFKDIFSRFFLKPVLLQLSKHLQRSHPWILTTSSSTHSSLTSQYYSTTLRSTSHT